ncbi:MAG TPA: hypothetical protein VF702_03320 [Allosphingosinicella sp.]|jgi:hypothetical protein
MQEHELAATAATANPQTCNLTYNIQTSTQYMGDNAATMQIQFSLAGRQLLWATQITQNNESDTTNSDMLFGAVGIKAGSTVSMSLFGSIAVVNFTGSLTDGKGDTTINNTQIAQFTLS